MARLTAITTTSGNAAKMTGGGVLAVWPWVISAGSNSRAVVARSRKVSSVAKSRATVPLSPKPSPLLRARAS